MPRILIVTGEASGDLHGAHLVQALKQLSPSLQVVGIGGASMQAAGAELVHDIPQLDVMGLIGLSAVKAMLKRISRIRRLIRGERWDLVVLIDNPGLNFHFARVAKACGLKVLYYIAPQLWAWRRGRMRWIQRRVDHVLAILPFEEPLYTQAGVRCTFVGNPILDEVASIVRPPGLAPAVRLVGRRRGDWVVSRESQGRIARTHAIAVGNGETPRGAPPDDAIYFGAGLDGSRPVDSGPDAGQSGPYPSLSEPS